MKKKQVVALLLTAAMTTASFMPSTGFFNLTEVQASVSNVTQQGDNKKYEVFTIGSENVTASAITEIEGYKIKVEGDEAIAEVLSGEQVKLSSTVSGSSFTTSQAITSMSGLTIEGSVVSAVGNVEIDRTQARVTSDTSIEIDGVEFATTVTPSGFGMYRVYFASGSGVSFGEVKLKVKVQGTNGEADGVTVSAIKVTDKDGVETTSGAVTKDGTLTVTLAGLKYEGDTIPEEYVSGGSFHYQWFYNAEADGSGTWVPQGVNNSLQASTAGAYKVNAWWGSETTTGGAYESKTWYVEDDEADQPSAITVGAIKALDSTKPRNLTASPAGYVFDNGAKITSEESLNYTWYWVASESSSSIKALEGLSGTDLKTKVESYKKVEATSKPSIVLSEDYKKGYVVVVAEDPTYGNEAVWNQSELLEFNDEEKKNPATAVTADALTYDSTAQTLTVKDPDWVDKDGKSTTVSTGTLAYDWYTISDLGNIPEKGKYTDLVKTAIESGAAVKFASGSATIKLEDYKEKFASATNVIVVLSDSKYEDIEKAVLTAKEVKYTDSGSNNSNSGRSNSSRSGSSSNSGNSGSSNTGSNSTSGSNTTNNNTSGNNAQSGSTTTPTTTPTSNVVTNADGSKTTTTTETKADGTKVESTKTEYPDGSSVEVTKETKPDGTIIETTVEKAANGDVATTTYTISPNGTKTKKVSIVKADGSSETTTITENKDGSATIVNEVSDANGKTSIQYTLAAGASGLTVGKIETTAKKVVIPAKIAIAGGAATLRGVTTLKANTLTLEGKTIKVTKIGAAALKGNKTATKLVIGKNIKTIGKQAFMNASKVKTVNIKGNVNTVKKNAFKNINKKATIKIKATAKQFKALKKKIKAKGAAPAKVTYKRVK